MDIDDLVLKEIDELKKDIEKNYNELEYMKKKLKNDIKNHIGFEIKEELNKKNKKESFLKKIFKMF